MKCVGMTASLAGKRREGEKGNIQWTTPQSGFLISFRCLFPRSLQFDLLKFFSKWCSLLRSRYAVVRQVVLERAGNCRSREQVDIFIRSDELFM